MKSIVFYVAILVAMSFTSEQPKTLSLPSNWIIAGSKPSCYLMGIDSTVKSVDSSFPATIKCIKKTKGFGTLMQQCLPDKFKGKILKVSGWLKLKDVEDYTGIWMRTDNNYPYVVLSFNNMYDQQIKGTRDWKEYSFEIKVPHHAELVSYGVLLSGKGQVWFDNIKISIIGDIPNTTPNLSEPVNLDLNQTN